MVTVDSPSENPIHAPEVAFHFIWREDLASVARYGVLSQYLLFRFGKQQGKAIYKAQKQCGMDLISIWDPWAFLRRHWHNRPLGNENRPWDILDFDPEEHFQAAAEIRLAISLKDPDPTAWFGISACQQSSSRKQLNKVRLKVASLVVRQGPAPGLEETEIHQWIDHELAGVSYSGPASECEICLLLHPALPKYDFPGYKRFESFVRGRISPQFILGLVTDEGGATDRDLRATAAQYGFPVFLTDGKQIGPSVTRETE